MIIGGVSVCMVVVRVMHSSHTHTHWHTPSDDRAAELSVVVSSIAQHTHTQSKWLNAHHTHPELQQLLMRQCGCLKNTHQKD